MSDLGCSHRLRHVLATSAQQSIADSFRSDNFGLLARGARGRHHQEHERQTGDHVVAQPPVW